MTPNKIDISNALQKVRDSGAFVEESKPEQDDFLTQLWNSIVENLNILYDSLKNWFKSLFPSVKIEDQGLFSAMFPYVVWILIGIFVIILLILLYKLLDHYRKTEKAEFTATLNIMNGKIDSKDWLQRSKQSASNGQYRDACRALYMSLIFYLDERKVIKYDEAKTNLEYLQTVKPKKELYNPLKQIINIFELLWYGKQAGTDKQYTECLDQYEKVVDE